LEEDSSSTNSITAGNGEPRRERRRIYLVIDHEHADTPYLVEEKSKERAIMVILQRDRYSVRTASTVEVAELVEQGVKVVRLADEQAGLF
jgi:hypothetical protein